MADYRVVKSKRRRCPNNVDFYHVTAVGTSDDANYFHVWTVGDVFFAIGQGDHFYFEAEGKIVDVRPVSCPGCMELQTLHTMSQLPTGIDAIVGLPELR